VALKELPNGVCAVHFEPVISAAEFLQQAEIMKCAVDEQQFIIECLSYKLLESGSDPAHRGLSARLRPRFARPTQIAEHKA
jgi:hypothetical protein